MATRIRGWAALACLLLIPHCLLAADTEASGGYSMLGAPGGGVAPIGWFASIAHQGGRRGLWTVVDVSGYHAVDSRLFTAGVGARLSAVRNGPRFFAQLLASVMIVGENRSGFGGLLLEPGVGLDVPVRPRTSVRIGASTPAVIVGEVAGLRMIRVQLGVTIPLTR